MNLRQLKFANLIISGKSKIQAYKEAYGVIGTMTAHVCAIRLLKKATIRDYVYKSVEQAQQMGFSNAVKEASEDIKMYLLDLTTKRSILGMIILGEFETERVIFVDGQEVRYKVKPTTEERLKAIDLDNKMTLVYNRDKNIINDSKKGVDGFIFEELKKEDE